MQIFFILNVSTNNISYSFALQGGEKKKKTNFFILQRFFLGLAGFVVYTFSTTNFMLLSGYSLQESGQTTQMQIIVKTVK